MNSIAPQYFTNGKPCEEVKPDVSAAFERFVFPRGILHPDLRINDILPEMASSGFGLVPGLSGCFEHLSPNRHPEAWELFADDGFIEAIRSQPKKLKSHLTVIEGAEEISSASQIPDPVREYLKGRSTQKINQP